MVPEINLLPKTEHKSPRNSWVLLILALVFVLLLVYFAIQFISLTKSIKSLENEQQILETKKIELETTLDSLGEPEELDLESSVNLVENISFPVSPLIVEINSYLNEHAYLREYTFTESAVQLKVDFETMPEVVSYVDFLSGSRYFEDVFVNQISTFDLVDNEEQKNFSTVDRYGNSFELPIHLDYLRAGVNE